MSQMLEHIIKNFNITDQVLSDRKSVGLYIESLSSLIVDRFYDYFLSYPDFAQYINKSELPRLKRARAQFIVSLFNDDFDEKLIEKIAQAHKDSPIKLNPYIIASTFEITTQTIVDIASVNHHLQKQLKTVLKFLHIAEFIIQKEFEKNNKISADTSKINLINALESLFEMLSIHKNKQDFLVSSWQNNTLANNNSSKLPSSYVSSCQFNTTLSHIKNLITDIDEFNIDINMIDKWHNKYHDDVRALYKSINEKMPLSRQEEYLQNIQNTSEKLFEFINKPFEQASSLTF